jgi:predicted dehydrogenase
VLASSPRSFREVDAITSAILLFPRNRIASYTGSFDSAEIATYSVLGTKGKLRLDMAYEYAMEICMEVAIEEKKQRRTYEKRDQFGAELLYFSDCVLNNRKPKPSGEEGLADVESCAPWAGHQGTASGARRISLKRLKIGLIHPKLPEPHANRFQMRRKRSRIAHP